MKYLTDTVGNRGIPAALNARTFWTNGAAVRRGEPAAASLDGTRACLGGKPSDRIGWGRLRSSASAGRCGASGLLNVVRPGPRNQKEMAARGNHSGKHTDPRGGSGCYATTRIVCCTCSHFSVQVSGNRVGRHFASHLVGA